MLKKEGVSLADVEELPLDNVYV